ncbi:Protein SRG1 [Glycine soja]
MEEITKNLSGTSLLVPSVQELAKEKISNVPQRYIQPQHEEDIVILSEEANSSLEIPVIDMQSLLSEESGSSELDKLHLACKEWGFFQLINHGVSSSLVEKVKLEIQDFFKLPMSEKKKFWQSPQHMEGFGQAFVVSEDQKLDWADLFFMTTLPKHLRIPHLFPQLPLPFRDALEIYSQELKKLAMVVVEQMGKALKMEETEMREFFEDGMQSMRMNYYPPCPQPEKVIGLTPHSDGVGLTILLQVTEVEGLQITKDGMWVPIKPLPNAFIINIGDMLEIISNGIYRSVEHRAMVNSAKERISIATFHTSKHDGVIGPATSLITEKTPARFKRIELKEFLKNLFALIVTYGNPKAMEEINTKPLATSLLVPSVQELAKQNLSSVPQRYIQHQHEDMVLICEETNTTSSLEIPVIDMHNLLSIEAENSELDKLHLACKEWGFFQLINHGVSPSLLKKLKLEIQDFFNLPMSEKKKFWQTPQHIEGFGQAYVVSEDQKLDWGDMFYMTTLPTHSRIPHLFPQLPLPFRDTLELYSCNMKNIAMAIIGQMGKALKIEEMEIRELFEDEIQKMRMNYYPPCPQPEKVIGLTNHSDGVGLTILLHVNEVEGLQIKKDGVWVPIKPLPNAFVVNIGEILEIVTNGIYQSIEHRATVNSEIERLSIATFHSPELDVVVGPVASLITEQTPARFKRIKMEDYFRGRFARKLDGKQTKTMEKFFNPSGTSLLVPSVQELATRNLSTVPQRYIQHQHEDMVLLSEEANISLEIFQLLTCRACFLQNLGLQNWLSFTLLARNGDSSRLLKKFTLLFLLISGSLLSTSFAGRVRSNSFKNLAKDVNAIEEGTPRKPLNKEEVRTIHERLLRANTKDYGRYDPSPSLSKPPFKLIPN